MHWRVELRFFCFSLFISSLLLEAGKLSIVGREREIETESNMNETSACTIRFPLFFFVYEGTCDF